MSLIPKIKLTLSAFLFLICAVSAQIAWRELMVSQSAAGTGMRKMYNEKVAILTKKSRTSTSLPEKEVTFRAALDSDDFAGASSLASSVLVMDSLNYWSPSPFADFLNGVIDYNNPSMERHLDAWVNANKKSTVSLIVRAQYEYAIGWHLRGQGFASTVRSSDWAAFNSYMTKALADVDTAIKIQKNPPVSFLHLKLQIQQGAGSSQERQNTFKQATSISPSYYPIYQLMLSTLQPKWGGSIAEMYGFVETHVAGADQHSPLRLLYLELYKDVVDAASIECSKIAGTDDDKSACMSSTMDRFGAGQLKEKVHEALLLYKHTDSYQFGVAIHQPIQFILGARHLGSYGTDILQMASSIMRSDIRLVEATPGRNHYVIDELVALSWYQAGHYENALQKEKEALEDLQNTVFPDGEAKDLARAKIYLQISGALGHLHDYVGHAAYERASYILGGRNGYEHAICFAFLTAGAPDEVLPACDEAVAADNDEVATRYWRAQALIDQKHGLEAVPDLERVAGSRDTLRATSAIDLSMIWFKQNDNRAALTVLTKHAYLYDETVTARKLVAIAYNNRCFAYMQLGDLNRALADCNRSLKYGEIPDAYAKKAELEKRLAGLPI